jgi:hypothetical protein
MSVDHEGTPGGDGAVRVELLLATVRDVVASLHRVSALLDHELTTLSRAVPPEHVDQLDALETENAQLREALGSRAVIEQAKGMLMGQHECDAETAFRMLVTASRRDGRKVRDVAASVVAATSAGTAGDDTAGYDEVRNATGGGPASPAPARSVVALPDTGRGAVTPARVAVGARPGSPRRGGDTGR